MPETTKREAASTLLKGAMAAVALIALVPLVIGIATETWGLAIVGVVVAVIALGFGLAALLLEAMRR